MKYLHTMVRISDVDASLDFYCDKLGLTDNTIFGVTTDNGTENFTWPDGGQTPFAGSKGMVQEGGFRVPMILRWPGKVPAGKVKNGLMSGMDWFPTFVKAAGYKGDIVADLKKGKTLNGKKYKVHLDGYDQTAMLTKGGESARIRRIWASSK